MEPRTSAGVYFGTSQGADSSENPDIKLREANRYFGWLIVVN